MRLYLNSAYRFVLAHSLLFLAITHSCSSPESSSMEDTVLSEVHVNHPDLSTLSEAVQEMGQNLLLGIAQKKGLGNDKEIARAFGVLGIFYLSHEFFDASKACLDNAISFSPDEFEWWYLSGYVEQLRGEPSQSILKMEKAYSLESSYLPLLLRLGDVYMEDSQIENAERYYKRALGIARNSWGAKLGYSQVLDRKGESQAAIDLLLESLETYPKSRKAHQLLASSYRKLGKNQEASFYLGQDALVIVEEADSLIDQVNDWKDPSRLALLNGDKYFVSGKYSQAIAEYEKAIRRNPQSQSAWNNMALSEYRLGNKDAAEEIFENSFDSLPDNEILNLGFAKVKFLDGKFDETRSLLSDFLERKPDSFEARFLLAKVHIQLEDWQSSESDLDKILLDRPEDNEVKKYTIVTKGRLGKWKEALELMESITITGSDVDLEYLKARLFLLSPISSDGQKAEGTELARSLYQNGRNPRSILIYAQMLSQSKPLEASEILGTLIRAFLEQRPGFDTSEIEWLRNHFASGQSATSMWRGYPFLF